MLVFWPNVWLNDQIQGEQMLLLAPPLDARVGMTERMMVQRMCGVSLKDRKRGDELLSCLGIECVENKIIIIIIIIIIALDNAPYKMLHKLKSACFIRKNQLWTSAFSSVSQKSLD